MSKNYINIKGARVNNLKNVDLKIPRNKFVVITGLSGSGKSSLAFDTIYAEGQRRYVESLSSYARQFVGLMDKPDVDLIEGLSPAISIDQKSVSHNPRSTVGTITEIYDYLRLLYSKIGIPICHECGTKLKKATDERHKKSKFLSCPKCNKKIAEFKTGSFSFNSNIGACSDCGGLATKLEIDTDLVLNHNLTINEGAIKPWANRTFSGKTEILKRLEDAGKQVGFDLDTMIKNLGEEQLKVIFYGNEKFEGIIKDLNERYNDTESNYLRQEIGKYMKVLVCPSCNGQRLKPESLAVKVCDYSIYDISSKNISEVRKILTEIEKSDKLIEMNRKISEPIIKEIKQRLGFISNVGLDYLTLDRSATTLSGGEAQRIRLATQVGSALIGVLYILDEPSIGLHQKDNDRLIKTLKALCDKGNSVIVVEHDESTILEADHVIDVGPGAGEFGGEIIFQGTPDKIKKCAKSLTGKYLSGQKRIHEPYKYREGSKKSIEILGVTEHNLKNIDVKIPLGKFVAITGVSGSGKSTLMTDVLANALNKKFYRAKAIVGQHREMKGLENIDKVINIDQSPIGRTPRSNPATYTGAFAPIRELFAGLTASKIKGFKAGHFSFNVVGGRCENCAGDGYIKVDMQFLSDVFIKCSECHGKRYKNEILDIYYRDNSILDVLDMTVEEAMNFFKHLPSIFQKISLLHQVGLGYLKLGQSATTLSGGEAQRIKLATELSRRATGKTLYILDEPTTGLHFEDVKKLLDVLNRLVDKGNTVLIIEHNLDVIKSVDWIIDIGPDGGDKGGEIVAQGTPKEIAKIKKGYTGKYLNATLKKYKKMN